MTKLFCGVLALVFLALAGFYNFIDNPDWEFFAFLSLLNYIGFAAND